MAQIPSKELVKSIQKQTKKDIRKKKIAYLFKGKIFKVPKGGSAGIVPKDIWERMKK